MRRHLGTTADLQDVSHEEVEKFFQAAKSAKSTDGKVTWQTIRATLLKRMTESKISKFESTVAVEELPAHPWVAGGCGSQVSRGTV